MLRYYIQNERSYGQRVRDIEHAVFTPRVLSTSGGMEREATTFYKCLADLLSNKRNHPNHGLVKTRHDKQHGSR